MKNIVKELQAAFTQAGHDAAPAPAMEDSLAIWPDKAGNLPATTVHYLPAKPDEDFGQFVWGGRRQWSARTSVGVDEIVRRVIHTAANGR